MAKTNKKDDKVMDVAKPGTSAPDASARPVIVGHRTILQDPMVTPAQKDEGKDEEKIVSTTAPTVKPLDEAISAEEPKKATKVTVKSDEKEADDPNPNEGQAYVIETIKKSKLDPPKEEPEKKDELAETPEEKLKTEADKPEALSDDGAATEAVAEQAAAKKTTDKEVKEAAARQETVKKLINEKTYNLPIGEAKRKRNLSMAVLLVLLIAAAIMAYLAIDAEVIKTSIKLPFEFFK